MAYVRTEDGREKIDAQKIQGSNIDYNKIKVGAKSLRDDAFLEQDFFAVSRNRKYKKKDVLFINIPSFSQNS